MKTKALFLSVGVAALLLLSGCGGETSQKSDLPQNSKSTTLLNQDNYLNLAKYYYTQESRDRNTLKSKSMQHLSRSKSTNDANTIYVKSNKTEDGTVKSMIIKNNSTLVSVNIDDESVNVTLHGAANEATQTLTLAAFRSFDMDEGEVK